MIDDYPRRIGLSPRVRGNRHSYRADRTITLKEGLSPRVRGNPSVNGSSITAVEIRVYPRVCGGTDNPPPRLKIGVSSERGVYPRVCGGTQAAYCPNLALDKKVVYPRVCGGTWRVYLCLAP